MPVTSDKITGLSPVISIEQKTTNKNPRSTVGTTTEIYDYLRLLFARAGKAYSYATGEEMVKYTEEKVLDMIMHDYAGKPIYILAPLVRSRKGHYRELFESMRRKGYLNIRVDGELLEITRGCHQALLQATDVPYHGHQLLRPSTQQLLLQLPPGRLSPLQGIGVYQHDRPREGDAR